MYIQMEWGGRIETHKEVGVSSRFHAYLINYTDHIQQRESFEGRKWGDLELENRIEFTIRPESQTNKFDSSKVDSRKHANHPPMRIMAKNQHPQS